MSKILFVENRFRTIFWLHMARILENNGHTIYWIVQNHAFKTSIGQSFIIEYPIKTNSVNEELEYYSEMIRSDRNINHFKTSSINHYPFYYNKISNIINEIHPDIVFGESTLFHELITIDICKLRSILYLHPCTCRFPPNRFSFYIYDSLTPYLGSNEILEEKDALEIIDKINKKIIVPDYMRKKRTKYNKIIGRCTDLIRLSYEYFKGEKFNTPHPFVKYKIEKEKKTNIKYWETIVGTKKIDINQSNTKVLYPLQFQPEANIDVWGRKHRNQFKLIKDIVNNLPLDTYLYVKPNPKSKYEISKELIDYIAKEEKIIPISHSTSMSEIINDMNIVLTVTGTIAIECILSNKPILTLIKTLNNTARNCIYIESLNEIFTYINLVRNNEYPKISDSEKVDFINLINKTSYEGITSQSFLSDKNLNVCAQAFLNVVNSISDEK